VGSWASIQPGSSAHTSSVVRTEDFFPNWVAIDVGDGEAAGVVFF
jgi:hypothetical protein